jgi:hypothetical protein
VGGVRVNAALAALMICVIDPMLVTEPAPEPTPCVYSAGTDSWLCPPGVAQP